MRNTTLGATLKELKDQHISEASLNFQDTDIKEFALLTFFFSALAYDSLLAKYSDALA